MNDMLTTLAEFNAELSSMPLDVQRDVFTYMRRGLFNAAVNVLEAHMQLAREDRQHVMRV